MSSGQPRELKTQIVIIPGIYPISLRGKRESSQSYLTNLTLNLIMNIQLMKTVPYKIFRRERDKIEHG